MSPLGLSIAFRIKSRSPTISPGASLYFLTLSPPLTRFRPPVSMASLSSLSTNLTPFSVHLYSPVWKTNQHGSLSPHHPMTAHPLSQDSPSLPSSVTSPRFRVLDNMYHWLRSGSCMCVFAFLLAAHPLGQRSYLSCSPCPWLRVNNFTSFWWMNEQPPCKLI